MTPTRGARLRTASHWDHAQRSVLLDFIGLEGWEMVSFQMQPCATKSRSEPAIPTPENDRYVFSMAAFKRSEMFDHTTIFCHYLEECYYDSKKFYVQRRMTYKNFITVIRQVCKVWDLDYTTQTRYYKSSYEMVYIINRFNRPPVDEGNR